MTEKNVKCEDCKFCDTHQRWCTIKALMVSPKSIRSCKVYAKRQAP